MIKKIKIKNFKRFEKTEFDLDSVVVFVGPNNYGKTTALQAIYLWELGLNSWKSHLATKPNSKRTTGLTINRKNILAIPNSHAIQLWKSYNVRKGIDKGKTENINIEIIADGETNNQKWTIGFEFIYGNQESIYCRILSDDDTLTGKKLYQHLSIINEKVGYLPPMSGLSSTEDKLEMGSINARIGEGQTAQVLRNLCWNLYSDSDTHKNDKWQKLKELMEDLFLIELQAPTYNSINGQIDLTYKENKKELNILNSGRGLLQVLLIFSYIYTHDSTILLIDEPDAHLEVLRQREIYNRLTHEIKKSNFQIIIASHSEVIINEAFSNDLIYTFLINKQLLLNEGNKKHLISSLSKYGMEQYFLANQNRWILYLEGDTDLKILREFAKLKKTESLPYLNKPFVYFLHNDQINEALKHFSAMKNAQNDLLGVLLTDKTKQLPPTDISDFITLSWNRREIENYIPIPYTLTRYLENLNFSGLFFQQNIPLLNEIINKRIPPVALENPTDSWWNDTKMTDDFLDKIFETYLLQTNQSSSIMNKSKYYLLLQYAKPEEIDPEVTEKLDAIYEVARRAEAIIQSEE
ncbi:MAG: hypothetical protein A2Y33_02065 [Spirochaetes bacterium GWF1_51_8]|nr:MAG: hypothetical protein A2Y33_02065 [Spirochaetes bacterium GWF1_51_8]